MLKRVRIKNFKSLDVDVSLDPVTVLIGASGTGKTNFVEALRFVRDYLLKGGRIEQGQGGWPAIASATATTPFDISFALNFTVPGFENDFDYLLMLNAVQPTGGRPVGLRERLVVGDSVVFHQEEGKWLQPPSVAHVPQPGTPGLNTIVGVPEVIAARTLLASNIGCYEFSESVFQSQGRPQQQPPTPQQGLSDSGDNFAQTLSALLTDLGKYRDFSRVHDALRRLNPTVTTLDQEQPNAQNQRNAQRIFVGHQFDRGFLALELGDESAGFRRFLACLMALYQTPSKQVVIIEEPEKGIHPGALSMLADEFNACPIEGRGQVILTTHSPQLLDHFAPESIRMVELENLVTKIRPIEKGQLAILQDKLLYPGELLTTVEPTSASSVSGTGE